MDSAYTLVTGVTGFLGRYLLRELLAAGRPVAVLVRDARGRSADERVDELVSFARESSGRPLPRPVVVRADLGATALDLSPSAQAWLASHCRVVVHAAACITLRATPHGEPWKTNVDGTKRLLDSCRDAGISEFHYVSTAFVCGARAGLVREDGPDARSDFRNDYERSKCEAERQVRSSGLRFTIYRPSVIVGDSVTGHTSSYQGIYRFLELGDRLAERTPGGRRRLPLRVPLGGDERRNLVPVDWVARAIARIVTRPQWHGRIYHLTSPEPVRAGFVKKVAERVLGIDGVGFAGTNGTGDFSDLERTFLEQLQEYWPYQGDDPRFDRRNTDTALPDLPCPPIDRDLMTRLIRFAVADRWGRASRCVARRRTGIDCAAYVERFFPVAASRSVLSRLPIDVTLGLEVHGPDGGRWTVCLKPAEAPVVRRGGTAAASVVYRTDTATFGAVVLGRQTPQQAFLDRRIEFDGAAERALKLAVLFGQFVRECPYPARPVAEEAHAAECG